ncbi:MAG: flagellar biosynthesis anti-sigma factor FlgM [Gammaproteobacteria bacterium]|nr:flagellar biosynthesis anti-sigma factor FlgM [Gammaproteobacteria bacterium]
MADKIGSFGRVGLDVPTTRSRAVGRPQGSAEAGPTQRARAARDEVELTGTAARLKGIEARLAEVPDVDRARVEELRERIESGNYRPDAARIAARLIRMEQDLA